MHSRTHVTGTHLSIGNVGLELPLDGLEVSNGERRRRVLIRWALVPQRRVDRVLRKDRATHPLSGELLIRRGNVLKDVVDVVSALCEARVKSILDLGHGVVHLNVLSVHLGERLRPAGTGFVELSGMRLGKTPNLNPMLGLPVGNTRRQGDRRARRSAWDRRLGRASRLSRLLGDTGNLLLNHALGSGGV
jgi:hypothetical protein